MQRLALGAGNGAAFGAETVLGATAVARAPVKTYLKRIREVCDRHGVLLILDEVMSGLGRTGHLFACAEGGIVPDIITIAKGLDTGYQPIRAMMAERKRVREGKGETGSVSVGRRSCIKIKTNS